MARAVSDPENLQDWFSKKSLREFDQIFNKNVTWIVIYTQV